MSDRRIVPTVTVQCIENSTKLTQEELDYVIYAVEQEAMEEGLFFAECCMFLRNSYERFDDLRKLLAISDDRYDQIIDVYDERLTLRESNWQELLMRHGLHWERDDFSESHQEILRKIVEQSRREAEVAIRFRILINGRKESLKEEDYRDLVEVGDYQFNDFVYLLNGYGDEFIGRLVRKFFERERQQTALQKWKKRQRKILRWKLLGYLGLGIIIGILRINIFQVFSPLVILISFDYIITTASRPMETI